MLVFLTCSICSPLGYERVYLPLYKVADTPFQIQGDDVVDDDVAELSHYSIYRLTIAMTVKSNSLIVQFF